MPIVGTASGLYPPFPDEANASRPMSDVRRRNSMSDKSVEVIEKIANPWSDDGRPPVYRLIVEAHEARGSACTSLRIEPPHRMAEFNFGPGIADSLVRPIVDAIAHVVRQPSKATARRLYATLCGQETISVVDTLLQMLSDELGDHALPVAALARRLIREAPDLRAVKAGVALLGVSGRAKDCDLIATVGLYEEITLYSAVAIRRLLRPSAALALWKLAKTVGGWGRIHAVNRLAMSTTTPEIRDWMLREGFRNRVLNEYLAYSCATAGGLKQALAGSTIDQDLLSSSADLLSSLILGGPAKDIEDYADGPAVCLSFLRHMRLRPVRTLRATECVLRIGSLVDGDRSERLVAQGGWTKALLHIPSHVDEVLDEMGAQTLVEDGLRSEDLLAFGLAAYMAPYFGIDDWPVRLERQRRGPARQFYNLMQTDRRDRIEEVLELARAQLDFNVIGSGPTISLGLGQEFEDDTELGMVIQDLRRFPGMGWDLLRIGLRNRVCRVRDTSIGVLEVWEKEVWPPDALKELRFAASREPDEEIRQQIEDLMSGRSQDSDTV